MPGRSFNETFNSHVDIISIISLLHFQNQNKMYSPKQTFNGVFKIILQLFVKLFAIFIRVDEFFTIRS
jgi:hypothetical protein